MKHKTAGDLIKPERLFTFRTIGGNHRCVAQKQLFSEGSVDDNIAIGMPQYAEAYSNCMYNLHAVQAKTVGSLDNMTGNTTMKQQAIDTLFLAQSAANRSTIAYIMANKDRFPIMSNAIDSLSEKSLEDFRKSLDDSDPGDLC